MIQMNILYIVLLFLVGCATTEQEKLDWQERAEIAEIRYQEVKTYCGSMGLPVNVECEARRACQKYPNSREKLTAYCVKWRNKAKFSTQIDPRASRDMERLSRRK